VPPSQGGSVGSNPVGATRVVAGQRPDRRVRWSGIDHLSVICPWVLTSATGGCWHRMSAVVTSAVRSGRFV
jgi:hypothetical protein